MKVTRIVLTDLDRVRLVCECGFAFEAPISNQAVLGQCAHCGVNYGDLGGSASNDSRAMLALSDAFDSIRGAKLRFEIEVANED